MSRIDELLTMRPRIGLRVAAALGIEPDRLPKVRSEDLFGLFYSLDAARRESPAAVLAHIRLAGDVLAGVRRLEVERFAEDNPDVGARYGKALAELLLQTLDAAGRMGEACAWPVLDAFVKGEEELIAPSLFDEAGEVPNAGPQALERMRAWYRARIEADTAKLDYLERLL